VPIVNIATPNGSGLSHNQFRTTTSAPGRDPQQRHRPLQNTQLGGIILGNPNLKGGAASVILNEVNGGSPSQLRGYTEVAGQSAKVIVANPYGITCNGCGFINTPTLTTGKPVIEGRAWRYQVDGSVPSKARAERQQRRPLRNHHPLGQDQRADQRAPADRHRRAQRRRRQSLKATARADDGSARNWPSTRRRWAACTPGRSSWWAPKPGSG
jgi:filamentous hemagglutinin